MTDHEPAAGDPREPIRRTADHAAIDRLADELIPALIAKLGVSNLGELEIREGAWRVRLRRPADGPNWGRRSTDRASRTQPGHEGHGHPPAAAEGRSSRPAAAGVPAGNGTGGALAAVGPGRPDPAPGQDQHRALATSPAVGVFQPGSAAVTGTRVRAGDRLGAVDMLGVPHEVIAPADGIVGAVLVEAGHAVEYGQELVSVELIVRSESPT